MNIQYNPALEFCYPSVYRPLWGYGAEVWTDSTPGLEAGGHSHGPSKGPCLDRNYVKVTFVLLYVYARANKHQPVFAVSKFAVVSRTVLTVIYPILNCFLTTKFSNL